MGDKFFMKLFNAYHFIENFIYNYFYKIIYDPTQVRRGEQWTDKHSRIMTYLQHQIPKYQTDEKNTRHPRRYPFLCSMIITQYFYDDQWLLSKF